MEEIIGGGGADMVFDSVGGDAFDASLRCVAWESTIPLSASRTTGYRRLRLRMLLRNCIVVGLDWADTQAGARNGPGLHRRSAPMVRGRSARL